MSPAMAAENMMKAMITIANEKATTGNYSEAIKTTSTFIESIESNESSVRTMFGSNLVPLYCLRAKSYFEIGNQSNDVADLDRARNDISKAMMAMDEFCGAVDPTQIESLKTTIEDIVDSDEQLRNDALSAVLRSTTGVTTHARKTSVVPLRKGGATYVWRTSVQSIAIRGLFFLAGLLYWALALGIFAIVFSMLGPSFERTSSSSFSLELIILVIVGFLGFAPVYFGIQFAAEELFGQKMTQATGFVVMMMAFTVIGMIPVCYLSGKSIARRFYG